MDLVWVGIGGALGSLTRFQIGKIVSKRASIKFPTGTFLINVSGCILLGIISNLKLGTNIYLLLGDGFLGAYTTFSTFMYEGFTLFSNHEKLNALIYIWISLLLGIIGYKMGSHLVRFFIV